MSFSYSDLKSRLNELKTSRKEYLLIKTNTINNLSNFNSKVIQSSMEKTADDLKEIDQQIEALSSIISTSVNIAMSIISPVQEKEQIITNISNTIDILQTENEIKNLLSKLEEENIIEKKIQIILEANNYIKTNPSIFESYREKFMQKSLDVLSYLNTTYLSLKDKIVYEHEKESIEFINEMDKTSILNFKLSNNTEQLISFFDFLANFISNIVCSQKKLSDIKDKINAIMSNVQIAKKEDIIDIMKTIKLLIQKIFIKISQNIQERQNAYLTIENSTGKGNEIKPIFFYLISKLVKGNKNILKELLTLIVKMTSITENNSEYIDLICADCSFVLSACAKFKFYISVLSSKVKEHYKLNDDDIINNDINSFFSTFDLVLYDIGEKYCNNEIKFMKEKIISLFEEESKTYLQLLEKHLSSSYDELSGNILTCIEDAFFILKMSGERAIETLNLQFALAIINNIKNLISEDLYALLDTKISAILVKTESTRYNKYSKIKYKCNYEPVLDAKNNFGNLFLISCFDAIDQTREDIPMLLEELNNMVNNEIVNSVIFDTNSIKLPNSEENAKNENNSYFKSNEVEMIKITFNDQSIILKKYDDFILKKLKLSFEYLYIRINTSVDMLNSVNYLIDQTNLATAEMSVSFSTLLIEETEKLLHQWKTQLSEGAFEKFLEYYADYIASYMEKVLKRKQYSSYGVLLLQKDINKIANYFQGDLMLGIRDKFNRLFYFVKILNFESNAELKEHLRMYDDIRLKNEEIDFIRSLKKD